MDPRTEQNTRGEPATRGTYDKDFETVDGVGELFRIPGGMKGDPTVLNNLSVSFTNAAREIFAKVPNVAGLRKTAIDHLHAAFLTSCSALWLSPGVIGSNR